jgi:5-formyltetrahydrofolate cyclo-ligase
MEIKKEIRQKNKRNRDYMTEEECCQRSIKICFNILSSKLYEEAEYVYGYYPLGNEVSLIPVMEDCLEQGKKLALPRVEGNHIDFYEITSLEQVKEGCFHVMEPITSVKMQNERALVLTPGVAFDKNGNRIGYGKGYYDRYFSCYPGLTRLGVSYYNQIEDGIPTEETDVRLQYLITERKMMEFNA